MVNILGRNHWWIVVPPLHHNRDNFICAQYKCHFQLPLCGLSSHNKCFENLSSCQSFSSHLPTILKTSVNFIQLPNTSNLLQLQACFHSSHFKIAKLLQLFVMQTGPFIQIEIQLGMGPNTCTQKTWSLHRCHHLSSICSD